MARKNKVSMTIKVELDHAKEARAMSREIFMGMPKGSWFKNKKRYDRKQGKRIPDNH